MQQTQSWVIPTDRSSLIEGKQWDWAGCGGAANSRPSAAAAPPDPTQSHFPLLSGNSYQIGMDPMKKGNGISVSRIPPRRIRSGSNIIYNNKHTHTYKISRFNIYIDQTRGKGPTDGGHTGTERRSTRRSTQSLRRTHQDQRQQHPDADYAMKCRNVSKPKLRPLIDVLSAGFDGYHHPRCTGSESGA